MPPKQAATQSTPKPKKKIEGESSSDQSDGKAAAKSDEPKEDSKNVSAGSVGNSNESQDKEPSSPRKDASTDPIELSGSIDKRGPCNIRNILS